MPALVGRDDAVADARERYTQIVARGLDRERGPLGSAAAAKLLASDVRLKTQIERIWTRPDGLGVYAFEYLPEAQAVDPNARPGERRIGVMAQEVAQTHPAAVHVDPATGYLLVNYGAL